MSWLIWPKGCQKCGGDLTPESDVYGVYVKCLHCGTITHEVMKPCFACAVPERRSAHQLISTVSVASEGQGPTAAAAGLLGMVAASPLVGASAETRHESQDGEGA